MYYAHSFLLFLHPLRARVKVCGGDDIVICSLVGVVFCVEALVERFRGYLAKKENASIVA